VVRNHIARREEDEVIEQPIHIEERDCIPADATVCHYDELGEDAKHCFPRLLDDGPQPTGVAPAVGRELAACEYIKFTNYYHIRAD
jgi:hypothetical protein